MKKNFGFTLFAILFAFFISCQNNNQNKTNPSDSSGTKSAILPTKEIPEDRKDVKAEPVAEYKEKTNDKLNDWYFAVSLTETPKTFNYLMKLQFEEIRGEDTLRFPNLGYEPKPVIQKGKDKYSCIIGFMDDKNQFMEYKLVHVENGNSLKVTTLKRYAVYNVQ